ncbi:hypothetical protein QZH41_019909 [Actinostola sp. cb2023]|nr:hypothetical protein QZH41_019909 [Actinostola sp. cb2023]
MAVQDTKVVTSEDLLNKIGTFGRYQILLLLFAIYAVLCWCAFADVTTYFLIAEPRWECVNGNNSCNITGSIGPGEEHYEYRCGTGISRQDWKFVDEYTSLVTQSVGAIIGGFVIGIVSDKFGRKSAFFLSGLLMTSLLLFVRSAQSFWMAAVATYFIGVAYYGCLWSSIIYIIEFVGIKQRTIVGNILWTSYGLGFMIGAGIGYLVREWTTFVLIITLCAISPLAMYWFVPESLRWLIVKGRVHRALTTLKKIAKINKKVIEDDIELPTFEEEKFTPGDIRLLFSPGYAKYTLVLWYGWFVNSLIYNGVHLSAPIVGGSLYFNWFLAGISELVSNLVAVYVHNR